jgi:hypothetical protein
MKKVLQASAEGIVFRPSLPFGFIIFFGPVDPTVQAKFFRPI